MIESSSKFCVWAKASRVGRLITGYYWEASRKLISGVNFRNFSYASTDTPAVTVSAWQSPWLIRVTNHRAFTNLSRDSAAAGLCVQRIWLLQSAGNQS